jgi:hypothetical protein
MCLRIATVNQPTQRLAILVSRGFGANANV